MHLLVKKLNLDIFVLASPRETLPKVLIKVPPPSLREITPLGKKMEGEEIMWLSEKLIRFMINHDLG